MPDTPEALTCAVCSEAAESAVWLSECFDCGRPFHLNPYNNQPGKDCGDAMFGAESVGIETRCGDCLSAKQRLLEAAVGPARARAEAMMHELHGDQLPLPPLGVSRPPVTGERRQFHRVEDD